MWAVNVYGVINKWIPAPPPPPPAPPSLLGLSYRDSASTAISLGRDFDVYCGKYDAAGALRQVDVSNGQVVHTITMADCAKQQEGYAVFGKCSMKAAKLGKFKVVMVDGSGKQMFESPVFSSERPGLGDFSFGLSCNIISVSGNLLTASCLERRYGNTIYNKTSYVDWTPCMEVSNRSGILTCEPEYNGVRLP